MRYNSTRFFQSGQILLFIVLVGAIALTVGLSVASRTITNVRTAREEESSQRALSAAEAGIQRVLNGVAPSGSSVPLSGGNQAVIYSTASVPVGGAGKSNFPLAQGNIISANQGIDVWLVPHNPNGDGTLDLTKGSWSSTGNGITVEWDYQNAACTPVEFIIISGSSLSTLGTTHYIANPYACSGVPSSTLPSSSFPFTYSSGKNGDNYYRSATFPITNGYVLRVVPLYTNTQIAIQSVTPDLPDQGTTITSVGASGDTQRKIVYYRGYPAIPTELLYTLYDTN